MARKGINKVILVGNVGQDPEVRYMPNGTAVANLTLATSESWKDQQGELQERTEWHKLVMYRKTAEIAGQYLKKGSQIYIEGKLQTRKWQDNNGQDRYTTEIIVDQMQMLGGRNNQQAQNQPQNNNNFNSDGSPKSPEQMQRGNQGNQSGYMQRSAQNQSQGAQRQNQPEPDFDFDDDIPF